MSQIESSSSPTEWISVQIPRTANDECEVIAKSHIGKKLGFTKKTQVVTASIRKYLDELYEKYPELKPRRGNNLILENKKTKKSMDISIIENGILCNQCHNINCEHVKFILSNQKIVTKLLVEGFLGTS